MHLPFVRRFVLLAPAVAALNVAASFAQEAGVVVGVGSRVFGPPPTRTIGTGAFTAGPGFVGYGYRPYYAGYGGPWYGGLSYGGAWYGGSWYGGSSWHRPPYFGYGYYGPWGGWYPYFRP